MAVPLTGGQVEERRRFSKPGPYETKTWNRNKKKVRGRSEKQRRTEDEKKRRKLKRLPKSTYGDTAPYQRNGLGKEKAKPLTVR